VTSIVIEQIPSGRIVLLIAPHSAETCSRP